MPLKVAKPPMPAWKAVRSMLGQMIATDADHVSALSGASPSSVAISTPHRVAVLGLDCIHSGVSLRSAATTKGWRFLVHNGKKVVATANSSVSGRGKHGFAHITDGPFVAGTERAIRRAESLVIVKEGQFEPIWLQVPAINVVALWLKNLDENADLIMPVPPAPKELRPYRPLVSSAFIAVVAELASRVMRDHADAHRAKSPKST
jgi:hypothetical protein